MIETVIFSLIFAKWKGYKVSKLFKHWSIYPIIATTILEIYFIYLMVHGQYWFLQYSHYIKTISFLFYLALVWKYNLLDISVFKIDEEKRPLLGLLTSPFTIGGLCIVIGSVLNTIAMAFNNWKMPVFPNVSYGTRFSKPDMFEKMVRYGDFHSMGNYQTHLIFLTDTHDLYYSVMSYGDILMRIFVVLTLYYSIKQSNR